MDDEIEDIKEANSIDVVVEKLGYKFDRDHGVSRRVPHTGGLVVNTKTGRYFWASKGWNGDAVDLVMKHERLEFQDAINWLADMAGRERPNWGKVDQAVIKAARAKENVFDIAQRVFVRWLQEDPAALSYVRGRGLTDEIIAASGIGFSGRATDVFYRDMRGEFSLYGIDPAEPASVAVLGYWGDMTAWAQKYNVDPASLDERWIEKGHVSGMLSTPGVVYPHFVGKRLVYFSRRHLPGYDKIKDDEGKEREWKSWNPPKAIVGERQFFFNHVWRVDAQECMIVEGQMDAITLALWGMPAIALCGLGNSPDSMTWLKRKLSKHLVIYLALDADGPGQEKVRKLGAELGPMTRIVRWPKPTEPAPAAEPEHEQDDPQDDKEDDLFEDAVAAARAAVAEGKKVTIALIQRKLSIGYVRAGRLHSQVMDELAIDAPASEEVAEDSEHGE